MKFSNHALLMAIAPTMIMHQCAAAASSPANTIVVSTGQNDQENLPGAMTAGSVSASLTSVSGAVDPTLRHPSASKLMTVAEKKRFLEAGGDWSDVNTIGAPYEADQETARLYMVMSGDGKAFAFKVKDENGDSNNQVIETFSYNRLTSTFSERSIIKHPLNPGPTFTFWGHGLEINKDGSVVSACDHEYDKSGITDAGVCGVYEFDETSNEYSLRGDLFFGNIAGDQLTAWLSGDGLNIAAWYASAGVIKVFRWDEAQGTWTQRGSDITGTTAPRISNDGSKLVLLHGNAVVVYGFENDTWVNKGEYGEDLEAVMLSGDGSTFVAHSGSLSLRFFRLAGESYEEVGGGLSFPDRRPRYRLSDNGDVVTLTLEGYNKDGAPNYLLKYDGSSFGILKTFPMTGTNPAPGKNFFIASDGSVAVSGGRYALREVHFYENPIPSNVPSDTPSLSPTSKIQNFASGAANDFQITASEDGIEFADTAQGGGSIKVRFEISKPPTGHSETSFNPSVKVLDNDCSTPIKDSNGDANPNVITVAAGGLISVPANGDLNMDYRLATVNVDVKQLKGSNVYSAAQDGKTGVLSFCVRADIGEVAVTGGEEPSSIAFVKMVFTITLNMEKDFSNSDFQVTIKEKEELTDTDVKNVDYGLQGCLCDAGTRQCITAESPDAFKVKSNSAFAICAYTDSQNVVIKSIRSLSITKGNIGYDVVNSLGAATDSLFTSLSNMGSNREVVVTRMLSIFYGDEDIDGTSKVSVAGKALLEFAAGRMRQLVSLDEVDVRSLQEAEDAGESAFDFDVQLDSAEIDEAGAAAKMSGYAMNVVVMALGMSMMVMPW